MKMEEHWRLECDERFVEDGELIFFVTTRSKRYWDCFANKQITHQGMLGNVHQKLRLLEMLDPKTVAHFQNGLLGKGSYIPPQY